MNRPEHTLRFLGGTETVTGSKYLIESGGKRVLVDCGLFQGYKALRERNREPFPVPPDTIDAVLLTHAPLPFEPHQRLPSAGALTTPMTGTPSMAREIRVAQTGTPRRKLEVPSMGSIIH